MKKLTILFASVALAFTLGAAGCKKKKDEAKTDTPATKPTETPADKPAEPTPDKPADPTAGAAPAAAGDLPASCGEYKAMIEKLASCEKMPQQARDALKQGYDAMSQGWANVAAMPPEAKTAMEDGCKKGTEALKQAAAATCGW